jgi:hypothetical protein
VADANVLEHRTAVEGRRGAHAEDIMRGVILSAIKLVLTPVRRHPISIENVPRRVQARGFAVSDRPDKLSGDASGAGIGLRCFLEMFDVARLEVDIRLSSRT